MPYDIDPEVGARRTKNMFGININNVETNKTKTNKYN